MTSGHLIVIDARLQQFIDEWREGRDPATPAPAMAPERVEWHLDRLNRALGKALDRPQGARS